MVDKANRDWRIAGVVMIPKKHICKALTDIYGIGDSRALEICQKVGVKPETKVADLLEEVMVNLQKMVASDYEVEGDLRRRVGINIKRLRDIKCYRGLRHRMGLPVRGQRTRTNARTRKGKNRSSSSASKAA